MKKDSGTGSLVRALLWHVPIVRSVMGYIETLETNTMSLLLLAQQVHMHQQILERFVSVSQALSASVAAQSFQVQPSTETRKPN